MIENHALVSYLKSVDASEIQHGDKSLLEHLQGVAAILSSWHCREPLVIAGMMHSVYGTKRFSTKVQALYNRHEIRSLVGDDAEEIIHLFSRLESAQFELAVQGNVLDQYLQSLNESCLDGRNLPEDIALLYLANWIEQRFKNTPRRAAKKEFFFVSLKQYLNLHASMYLDNFLASI